MQEKDFLGALNYSDEEKTRRCYMGSILIVDDEPKVLKYLEKYLQKRGLEVRTADSGEKGLEIVKTES
ncbi:MAG: response regulator, partial [Desulfonatronovibrio sp.]